MLEREQGAIAAALLRGPDHLPADLFAGDAAAVLRGLRVHANTISHARLVALEETFPRARDYLGKGPFNRLSRAFVESGGAEGRALTHIGLGFPAWLDDPVASDLARVEWAWLESYNAAEATALAIGDLAGLGEAGLLSRPVRLHPAVRIVELSSEAARLVDPAFDAGATALLVIRPEAEVRLAHIHPVSAAALDLAEEIAPLGNLLAYLAEHHPDGGAAVAALIEAGAFERL